MIKSAKEVGFVTYDALNAVLPPEEFTSEQIEDIMSMLSEMGITVVENDGTDDNDDDARRPMTTMKPRPEKARLEPRSPKPPKRPPAPTARMIRCACICAKWVPWNCCRAKAK